MERVSEPLSIFDRYPQPRKVMLGRELQGVDDMAININNILNLLAQGTDILAQANVLIDEFKAAKTVFTSKDEEQLEAAIAALEAELPALRERVQNKLRGG